METPPRKLYRIRSGTPSWHQSRAGHAYAGEITAAYTPAELAAYLAKLEARNEPHHVTNAEPTTTPNQ
jgi:hypothetical protein